jgi:DNA-binding transcriptional ArsR family regulator
MAWEHITLVSQAPLQYIAKLILFALASRVDDEGKCWPSIDTICHDTGLKHRTTQLHLKSLVESGYVIRQERPGRTALLWINTRILATGVSGTPPHDLHRGVHAPQESGAGHAPEVEIEQPINRQLRKLSTIGNPAASDTAPTTWWTASAGIDAKGRELQVPARPGEGYAAYKDRLFAVEKQRRKPP